MVYTSIPAYIDPVNWHQQQQPNHQQNNTGGTSSQLLHPPPPPLPPSTQQHGASTSSIRPGSMADRARMANIPMQEPAQKCPRCESTNTKFCYFNNYSLSQPRHFCKTCRRYWTRGGALRNVPVGGGCRRNKRTKGTTTSNNGSKSPPPSSDRGGPTVSGGSFASEIAGLSPPVPSSLRFMAPLMHHQQLGDHFSGVGGGDLGLNYAAISGPMGGMGDLNFHIGSALRSDVTGGGNGGSSLLSAAGLEQWRVPQTQQFSFLTGFEASSHGLYQFENSTSEGSGYGGGSSGGGGAIRPNKVSTFASVVKMEESNNNLPRQFLGMNNNSSSNSEHFVPASWTHLSGFTSSNTTNNPP
ncbi:hypothetical protein HN51_004928 [Arachis hypogaea]|uniref:Dof zinc finger protein n=3 Tax=Arachis TaxID=3817 RepID=A0A444WQI6_ARAHY|nr:dof zinc finger protein DOF2.4-like isoform X1 [Arachis duranensis]XP_025695227.1 dof zinc finger protein DOF2.4 isoform X1 [Arachis hypogaea]QHO38602.1 Dof zinc finger protein [Arachis hypogaea]RYQ79683.1 hypothetical protein Ahy_Scaffold2g107652 [Arachis hypogaea]